MLVDINHAQFCHCKIHASNDVISNVSVLYTSFLEVFVCLLQTTG